MFWLVLWVRKPGSKDWNDLLKWQTVASGVGSPAFLKPASDFFLRSCTTAYMLPILVSKLSWKQVLGPCQNVHCWVWKGMCVCLCVCLCMEGGAKSFAAIDFVKLPTAYPTSGLLILHDGSGLPRWLSDKESACQGKRRRRPGFSPWVWKIPWRRKWQPTPVFWPGKSHGQGAWQGYNP